MMDINKIEVQSFEGEDDPLVFLRQHRREISEQFKTVSELTNHLKQFNSVDDALTRVRSKIAEKKRLENVR